MRKMDEMELYISMKSIKIAWFYSVIFLFIWTIYDLITTGGLGLAGFLLITQNLIYYFINATLKGRMEKDEK